MNLWYTKPYLYGEKNRIEFDLLFLDNEYSNERQLEKQHDTPLIVPMKPPCRKLSNGSRPDSKTKRIKRGRKTADAFSQNRRSTTPNVINLHMPANRPTTNQSTSRKNELLQRISLYNGKS